MKSKQIAAVLLISAFSFSFSLFSLPSSFATSGLVSEQFTSTSCSLTVSVSQGNQIVVVVFTESNPVVNDPTDTQGNKYPLIMDNTNVGGIAVIYVFTNQSAIASGSDTVSVNTCSILEVYVLNGFTVTKNVIFQSNGHCVNSLCTACSSSSLTVPVNYFVVEACGIPDSNSWQPLETAGYTYGVSNVGHSCAAGLDFTTAYQLVAANLTGTTFPMNYTACGAAAYSELAIMFSPCPSCVAALTTTVTAWNVPDTNGLNSGMLFLIFLLVPTFLLIAIPIRSKHKESYVTFILLGLIFSSLLGGLVAGIPLALTGVFVGIFVIYLWKGKPKGGTVT